MLSGRKNTGKTEGTISFSGSAPSRAFLRRFTGYVEQFDTLLGTLTVREMLLYTAEMKRSIKEPYAEKAEAVDAAIEKLGLEVCKNVVIGGKEHKGISGGQAKRVNIGLALISSPRVLFLDEPTTGLDSFTANEVMTTVKAIAEDNVTICATIHSPTQYAFSLFDNLLMLSRGQVVYFGSCRGAVPFAKASWGKFVQEDRSDAENEAEWLTDLITATDRDGQTDALAAAFASAPQCASLDADVEKYLASSREDLPQQIQDELATRSETSTPWWWGLKTMVKYRAPRNYRDPDWIGSRLGDKVIMSLLMWTLYFGVGRTNGRENLINVPNLLFRWCILPAYGAAGYLPSLVMERALYVRERSDGLYLAITYLLAKMVEELTIALVTSVWVSAAAFYAMGLQVRSGSPARASSARRGAGAAGSSPPAPLLQRGAGRDAAPPFLRGTGVVPPVLARLRGCPHDRGCPRLLRGLHLADDGHCQHHPSGLRHRAAVFCWESHELRDHAPILDLVLLCGAPPHPPVPQHASSRRC